MSSFEKNQNMFSVPATRVQGKKHKIHQRVEIATFNKKLSGKKKNGITEAKDDMLMLQCWCGVVERGWDADDSATRQAAWHETQAKACPK